MSKTQDKVIAKIQQDAKEIESEDKESFLGKQRQASIACLPNNKSIKGNIPEILLNLEEYSPKTKEMLEIINKNPGKHIIYSNFVEAGVDVIEKLLIKNGWKNIKDVIKNEELWNQSKGNVFATWSGNTKDVDKQIIKNIANSKDNLFGDKIRVIIGSPSIKEGVSFKHIQHMHLLDPVWNESAKNQVEGRAIRFCSHVDIDEKLNAPLKRKVIINIYKLMPREKGEVIKTSDQLIYDDIIVKKQILIKAAESALKKVAIDYYLFRNLYTETKLPSPIIENSPINSAKSELELSVDIPIKKDKDIKEKKDTCPKPRRPKNGHCDPGFYLKKNKQDFECCYKSKKSSTKKSSPKKDDKKISCPKDRLPPCKEGYILKENASGVPCCFKIINKK
jgi:hypothetical protein